MSKYEHFFRNKPTLFGRLVNKAIRERLFKILGRFIKKSSTVLEIGPGQGHLAKWLIQEGHSYICYDNNEKMLEHARELGAKTRLQKVPPLAEEASSVDFIVLSHVFEHITDYEKAYELLECLHTTLKKGGRLFIFSPNFHSWKQDFYEIDYAHALIVTPLRLTTMFQDAGFKVVFKKGLYGSFGFLPGWFIDVFNRIICQFLLVLFPFSSKLVKAKIMFHQNIIYIGEKT
jgi:SAM-dependent methyltransferase